MPFPHVADRWKRWLPYVPLLLFVVLGTAYFWNAMGDDLASSYVGCRVVATGNGEHLYSYDPVNFAGIADTDTVWPALAAKGNYTGYLHPYVQTPLWAWALQPLCNHTQWPAFKHLFLVLALLSIAGCIALTARFWTPRLFTPLALAAVLVALAFSEPFLFAMQLVQTHALLLFLTVAGLLLAERDRPGLAGFCVACAAAVKISPGVLLVYWLVTRRWRAAFSFVLWSAALLMLTRFAIGPTLFHAYLADMHRVSGVLLVSENNQSLASWYMGRFFSPDEVFDVNAFPLPAALRQVSLACIVLFAALGGGLDGSRIRTRTPTGDWSSDPPFGAGMALVAMTIFAPVAWTHYYIVLVIPLMMLAQAALESRGRWERIPMVAIIVMSAALLYRPLAPDVIHMDLSDDAVLRGVFFAGLLNLAGLIAAAWRISRRLPVHPQTYADSCSNRQVGAHVLHQSRQSTGCRSYRARTCAELVDDL